MKILQKFLMSFYCVNSRKIGKKVKNPRQSLACSANRTNSFPFFIIFTKLNIPNLQFLQFCSCGVYLCQYSNISPQPFNLTTAYSQIARSLVRLLCDDSDSKPGPTCSFSSPNTRTIENGRLRTSPKLRVYTAYLTYRVFYACPRLEPRLLSPVPGIFHLHKSGKTCAHYILLFLNGSLFSRHPSRLDAFSAYDLPRSCAACLVRQLLTRSDRMLIPIFI